MLRFQLDRAIMVKRWRREWEAHGKDFGNCHCGRGMGTMRKHRPFESHPSSSCSVCGLEQMWKWQKKKRERMRKYRQIQEGISSVWLEHLLWEQRVVSSNLTCLTKEGGDAN